MCNNLRIISGPKTFLTNDFIEMPILQLDEFFRYFFVAIITILMLKVYQPQPQRKQQQPTTKIFINPQLWPQPPLKQHFLKFPSTAIPSINQQQQLKELSCRAMLIYVILNVFSLQKLKHHIPEIDLNLAKQTYC